MGYSPQGQKESDTSERLSLSLPSSTALHTQLLPAAPYNDLRQGAVFLPGESHEQRSLEGYSPRRYRIRTKHPQGTDRNGRSAGAWR